MYCDFCNCHMCQTGQVRYCTFDGTVDEPDGVMPVLYHTQTIDGKWICETCYRYDVCANNKSDPCEGLCGEYKCDHRLKLLDTSRHREWTFWTWRTGPQDATVEEPHFDLEE